MDEIIRFIEKNPFVAFGIAAFVLAQIFGRKKGTEAKDAEQQKLREEIAARQQKLREERAARLAERTTESDLAAALRSAREASSATTLGSPSNTLILSSAPVLGAEEVDDSTSIERPIVERGTVEQDAYDIRSNVYDNEPELQRLDTDALPVGVHRGYAFHNTVEEPQAQEYHTQTFFGFQEAHGLHSTGPVSAESVQGEARGLLHEPPARDEIVRAIILGEVLGPPLARRR